MSHQDTFFLVGIPVMRTREVETSGAWRSLVWGGLIVVGLSGCGGGNDDFGPTMKPKPPTGNGGAGAAASTQPVAVNPANPVAASEKVSAEEVAPKKDDAAKTPPTSDMLDAKGAVATPANDQQSRPASREGDEAPVQVAKAAAATTPAPEKVKPAKKSALPPDSSEKAVQPAEPAPEVIRQPLSSEAHEWLMAKHRQVVAHDGQSVLTAADLSKVSWHDLRTSQLTREFFGRSGRATGLGIGPQGYWVLGAAEAGWVRLWTMETQTGLDRFARQAQREAQRAVSGFDTEQGGVRALAVSPIGDWFVTGGEDGSLCKCSVETTPALSSDGAAETQASLLRTVKLENNVDAHAGSVTALKISADGAWVVSGGTDQQVRLWDTKTWTVARTWSDMPTQILDVSVSADGRVVAATGLDKFARWWSAEASETPPESASKKDEDKPAAVESKTNKSAPKDAKESEEDADVKPKNGLEHPDLVLAVAVSSDGKQVATGCKDKLVRVWDLATGKAIEKHDGSKEAVVEVRFLDQDRRLIFADRSGNVWSKPRVRRSSGDGEDTPAPTDRTYVFATPASALSPAESVAAVSSNADESSGIAALQAEFRKAESPDARNVLRHELLQRLHPNRRDEQAEKAAQVAALEKQLAGAVGDSLKADLKRQISRLKSAAIVQEKSDRPRLIGTLTNAFPNELLATPPSSSHSNGVQFSFLDNGELLAAFTTQTTSDRNDEGRAQRQTQTSQIWVWDVATQTLLRHWDDVPPIHGVSAWLDAAGQILSLNAQTFSLPDGRLRTLSDAASEPLSTFGISPDGKRFAVGYAGAAMATSKVLRLLDADTLREQQSHTAFESVATAVAFSPDGASLAVAIRERLLHRLLMMDAKTLAVQAMIEEVPHSASWLQSGASDARDRGLTKLVFSADGRFLLTHGSYGSGDYRLTLWQKKRPKWARESAVNSKAGQPLIDESRFPASMWFVGGRGGQIGAITSKGLGIVDTSNGRLLRTVELRDVARSPLGWSSDGMWMAQGDDVGYVTLWNLRVEKEAAIFPAQLGPVKALALSHDGRVLATLGEENKLYFWNLEGWQPKNRVAAKSTKMTKPAASSD